MLVKHPTVLLDPLLGDRIIVSRKPQRIFVVDFDQFIGADETLYKLAVVELVLGAFLLLGSCLEYRKQRQQENESDCNSRSIHDQFLFVSANPRMPKRCLLTDKVRLCICRDS